MKVKNPFSGPSASLLFQGATRVAEEFSWVSRQVDQASAIQFFEAIQKMARDALADAERRREG